MYRYLSMILASIMICSCNLFSDKELLRLSHTEANVGADGGRLHVDISGSSIWESRCGCSWMEVSRDEAGAEILVEANPGKERTDSIVFLTKDDSRTFVINQEASEILETDTEHVSIGYSGGSFNVFIECYRPWKISSEEEWITTDLTQGDSPSAVVLSADFNEDVHDREGKVTVSCGQAMKEIIVTQKRMAYIDLETDIVEADGDGGIFNVLYLSNVEVDITRSEEWIRMIDTGSQLKRLTFEVMRNTSEAREGYITVTEKENEQEERISKTLTIRQGPKIYHPDMYFAQGNTLLVNSRDPFRLTPVMEDVTDSTLSWNSSDMETAEVSADGVITPHRSGRCIITAVNATHRLEASLSLDIRFKASGMIVFLGNQDMTENPAAVRYTGDSMTLSAEMIPADAYSEDLIFISDDSSVASVTGHTLTCMNPGTATIYAESVFQGLRTSFKIIVISDAR